MKILGCCWAVLFIQVYAYSAVAADVRLQAKSDAELDVSRYMADWNAVAYLGISGCVSAAAGVPAVLAVFLASAREVEATVCCTGISVCALISTNVWIGFSGGPSTLPPERLIGKSPEYVEVYTDVYKASIRSERTKLGIVGSTFGFCVGSTLALPYIYGFFDALRSMNPY